MKREREKEEKKIPRTGSALRKVYDSMTHGGVCAPGRMGADGAGEPGLAKRAFGSHKWLRSLANHGARITQTRELTTGGSG
jgi:hypothetical protein